MNNERVTGNSVKNQSSNSANNGEMQSSDSSGLNNKEESKKPKKRHQKLKRKQMEYSNSSSMSNEKPMQKESNSEYSSVKLFKIEKVARNSSESISNSDQKNSQKDESKPKKEKKSHFDLNSSLDVKKGCSLVVLNKGEILIQGNQIETSVPCKVEKLKNTVTSIIPTKTVRIIIEELDPSSVDNSDSDKKNPSSSKDSKNTNRSQKIRNSSTEAKSQSTSKTKKEESKLGSQLSVPVHSVNQLSLEASVRDILFDKVKLSQIK